jgi:molybdopterin converting factor small subunit
MPDLFLSEAVRVTLSLYASLERYLPEDRQGNSCTLEMEEGSLVSHLFTRLSIPSGIPRLIFINGVHASKEAVLKNGDEVGVFPPVAGGSELGPPGFQNHDKAITFADNIDRQRGIRALVADSPTPCRLRRGEVVCHLLPKDHPCC